MRKKEKYVIIGIFWILLGSALISLLPGETIGWSMDTDLSTADASFIGEDAGDLSGRSVSGAGDVNGDGFDDILIGAEHDEEGGYFAGQTYLIFGKATGWSMGMDLSTADASFIGEDGWDYSGYSVSGAGDVNGDGFDDILIGAWLDKDFGSTSGQTYLILGKVTGWSMDTDLSTADASFIGEDAWDWSGLWVSGAGDLNGDGFDDILIGAYGNDDGGSEAGQTYLILGKVTGWSMDTDLSTADASFIGEDAGDFSGYSVSGPGDVNGDGYDDILIGADRDEDGGELAGQTYLIFGKATGWLMDTDLSTADASFIGEDAGDFSGISVSGAGDVNGDGYDDILIGAYGSCWSKGQTYLILGKVTGWSMDTDLSTADASFIGEDAWDWSGLWVSGAGDLNGDGFDDILIGAYGNDDGGSEAGQTYLILGKVTGWSMDTDLSTADASFIGEDAWDWSGLVVSGAGDLNGDGYDDILIGAWGDDDGGSDAGQTYLIFGIQKNFPPIADAGGPYSYDEGSEINFDASLSSDPNGDTLEYRWDFDNDGIWDTSFSNKPIAEHKWNDDYMGKVKVEVTDGILSDTAYGLVTVKNIDPSIDSCTVPMDPVSLGNSVSITVYFSDDGSEDTHTATIDWGDSSTSPGTVTETNGAGTIKGSHTYSSEGVYKITIGVIDDDGGTNSIESQYVVIYDPNGGFVTGGGWFNSPMGAYCDDTSLTGKANFGFVSKYQKGSSIPSGNTVFHFATANFKFSSTEYQWLVIANKKALIKGNGTVNAEGSFGFMISAIDGDYKDATDDDTLRIKIWNKDSDEVVYDNMIGEEDDEIPAMVLDGGSITLHEK